MHSGDLHLSVLYSSSPGGPVNNQGSLRPPRILLVSCLFLVALGFE